MWAMRLPKLNTRLSCVTTITARFGCKATSCNNSMINRPLTASNADVGSSQTKSRRLVHQCPRDGHALLLPARQINRQSVHPVNQSDLLTDHFGRRIAFFALRRQ